MSRWLRREGGEVITRRPQRDVLILAERPQLTVTWSRYAPRERGPDLHVHRKHVDAFFILEGELAFTVGPDCERVRLTAGGFAAVPPDVVHSFANESGADAAWLNFHAPDCGFAASLRSARDGRPAAWDSFDPPSDGGRSAKEVLITSGNAGGALRELDIAVVPAGDPPAPGTLHYALSVERAVAIRAPA